MITQMSRRAAGMVDNSMEGKYLTFVPLDDEGCSFSFSQRGTGSEEHPTIEYSIDRGVWTALESEASTPTVAKGHEVRWRGEIVPETAGGAGNPQINGIGNFSSSGEFNAYGNPLSIKQLNFVSASFDSWCLCHLFKDSSVVDASRLYISKNFAPASHYGVFDNCSSLVAAPNLPSTAAEVYCCTNMFRNCTALMIAPNLQATTTATKCYSGMFRGCTSLVTAPELPTKRLSGYCYSSMFYGCSSLSYIKMLATNISASNCLANWVNGVAAQGTFVKNAAMTDLPTGNSGIPSGWTVIDDPSTVTE